jgi:Family of unknown function (DUF6317)
VSGPGYQVVMQDLLGLSRTFRTEAASCKAVMPEGGPVGPDGGDGAVNGMLHAVTGLIGLAHLQVAGAMEQHADRLQASHDLYAKTETDLTRVAKDLTARAGLG